MGIPYHDRVPWTLGRDRGAKPPLSRQRILYRDRELRKVCRDKKFVSQQGLRVGGGRACDDRAPGARDSTHSPSDSAHSAQ